jgi:hypothetical protein
VQEIRYLHPGLLVEIYQQIPQTPTVDAEMIVGSAGRLPPSLSTCAWPIPCVSISLPTMTKCDSWVRDGWRKIAVILTTRVKESNGLWLLKKEPKR